MTVTLYGVLVVVPFRVTWRKSVAYRLRICLSACNALGGFGRLQKSHTFIGRIDPMAHCLQLLRMNRRRWRGG